MDNRLKDFKKVFLIAGSEPLGSAGLQADIKAVSACGGFAAGAVTCIVDEDTQRVKDIYTIPVQMIVNQALSFLEDVGADCIKTGMLYSVELVTGIAELLKQFKDIPNVIDPVMVSSAGDRLLKEEAVQAYKDLLFPMAAIITPNYREAAVLLGRPVSNEQIKEDLQELCQWGNAVILKSVPGEDTLTDYFYDPRTGLMKEFSKQRILTKNVNGTGDTFASSIATYVARGYALLDAVRKAEVFIQQSIESGAMYKFGSGFGPVHPFFREVSYFREEDLHYAALH